MSKAFFEVLCLLFAICLPFASATKCYECRGVEGNGNACVQISTPCQPEEDACISHVHYTTPTAYYSPLAERKHFISKGCVSYAACVKQRAILQRSCTYDWFSDWSCAECCRGDLCNYYVKLSAHCLSAPSLLLLLLLLLAMVGCSFDARIGL